MGFHQNSSLNLPNTMDGTFGFYIGGYDYLVGGWDGTAPTYKTVYRSDNRGVTWAAQTDFNHKFHTAASCVVDDKAYIVGGDFFNPSIDGDYRRSSHKFETGSWSQIASNAGIGNRCLGGMVYLNGSFYIVGGQDDISGTNVFDTVMRSDDGCQSFTTILADTKTQGFTSPLSWGSVCVHQGLIWAICGSRHAAQHGRKIISSSDGINWTFRGWFRGMSRSYAPVVSHNGKIYVFNGNNPRFNSTGNPDGNLSDYWTIEVLNGGRIVQTYKGDTGWARQHAISIWSTPYGIMMALGGTRHSWLFEV